MSETITLPHAVVYEVVEALTRAIGLSTLKEPSLAEGFRNTATKFDEAIEAAEAAEDLPPLELGRDPTEVEMDYAVSRRIARVNAVAEAIYSVAMPGRPYNKTTLPERREFEEQAEAAISAADANAE